MINIIYVEMLAIKIYKKEVNPMTSLPFVIGDVKIETYKKPILDKIKELELEEKENETIDI